MLPNNKTIQQAKQTKKIRRKEKKIFFCYSKNLHYQNFIIIIVFPHYILKTEHLFPVFFPVPLTTLIYIIVIMHNDDDDVNFFFCFVCDLPITFDNVWWWWQKQTLERHYYSNMIIIFNWWWFIHNSLKLLEYNHTHNQPNDFKRFRMFTMVAWRCGGGGGVYHLYIFLC